MLLLDEKDASENLFSQQQQMMLGPQNSILNNMPPVNMGESIGEQPCKVELATSAAPQLVVSEEPGQGNIKMVPDSHAIDIQNSAIPMDPEENLYPDLEEERNHYEDQ